MSPNNIYESYVRHPLEGTGFAQSFVAQTRHPHDVFHRQRRQYVQEHQLTHFTENFVHYSIVLSVLLRRLRW